MHNRLLNALMLIFLSLPGIAKDLSPENNWQKADYIEQSFTEIALRNEYKKHTGQVRKWQDAIKIWVDHRVTDSGLLDKLTRLHIQDLNRITGHPIELVTRRDQANLVLVYTRYADMPATAMTLMGKQVKPALAEALCLANITTTTEQVIKRASIIIPVDEASSRAKLVDCVVEELTQIMGLVNDSEKVYPSVFNDKSINDLLSGLDYVLLKILYDKKLTPGMSEQQSLQQVRQIIQRMQQDGTLDRASSEVRQSGLYSLLGYR